MQTLYLTVPRSWLELDDNKLSYVYRLVASEFSATEIPVLCLIRWNNIKVLYRDKDGFVCRKDKFKFVLSAEQIRDAVKSLDWLGSVPDYPVRISRFGRHRALNAEFAGVPFRKYIFCDNLYQGWIATKNNGLLDKMANVLYDCDFLKCSPLRRIAIFYWFAALKQYFAMTFCNFYRAPSGGNLLGTPAQKLVREAMNAQIRALTKGDITKEKEVLEMDTWRALTELDALAKEYDEINSKYGKQ